MFNFFPLLFILFSTPAHASVLTTCLKDFSDAPIVQHDLSVWPMFGNVYSGAKYSYSDHGKIVLFAAPSAQGQNAQLFYDGQPVSIKKESTTTDFNWIAPGWSNGEFYQFGECAIFYAQSSFHALADDTGLNSGAPVVVDFRKLRAESIEDRANIHWSIEAEFGPLLKFGNQLILAGKNKYDCGDKLPFQYYSFDSLGKEAVLSLNAAAAPLLLADNSLLHYCDSDVYVEDGNLHLYRITGAAASLKTELITSQFESFIQCDVNHGVIYTSAKRWPGDNSVYSQSILFSNHPGIGDQEIFNFQSGSLISLVSGNVDSSPIRITKLGDHWLHEVSVEGTNDNDNPHVLYLTDENGSLIGKPIVTQSPAFVFKNKVVSINICGGQNPECNQKFSPVPQEFTSKGYTFSEWPTAAYFQITNYDLNLGFLSENYFSASAAEFDKYELFRKNVGYFADATHNVFGNQPLSIGFDGPLSTLDWYQTDEAISPTLLLNVFDGTTYSFIQGQDPISDANIVHHTISYNPARDDSATIQPVATNLVAMLDDANASFVSAHLFIFDDFKKGIFNSKVNRVAKQAANFGYGFNPSIDYVAAGQTVNLPIDETLFFVSSDGSLQAYQVKLMRSGNVPVSLEIMNLSGWVRP
jgi:hypothetical protein